MLGNNLREAALELRIARHTLFLIERTALGIVLPGGGGRFVTSDVEHLTREKLCNFGQNVFGKLDGTVVGHVEHVGRDAARHPHAVRSVRRAAELGIGRHGGGEVARHLDFRNDGDVELRGVVHHVADFLLRVVVGAILVVGPVLAVFQVGVPRIAAFRGHRNQFRVFFHLHAPALVVGQVPVEVVHLVVRHQPQHLFHLFDGEEMAAHVEHESAIGEARRVVDGDAGDGVVGRGVEFSDQNIARQHLFNRLQAIEKAPHGARLQRDAVGVHQQDVALVDERRGVHCERDAGTSIASHGHRATRGCPEHVGEVVGLGHDVRRQPAHIDRDALRKHVFARFRRQASWPRRQVYRLCQSLQAQTTHHQQNCLDFRDSLHNYPDF